MATVFGIGSRLIRTPPQIDLVHPGVVGAHLLQDQGRREQRVSRRPGGVTFEPERRREFGRRDVRVRQTVQQLLVDVAGQVAEGTRVRGVESHRQVLGEVADD
ncbi:hypothetical protein QEN36_18895, partial [Gordonia alkanivorans]|uniref:hypothetical protein n=1 Tax=Gordonia alkanivorans TaxID=84096 RepID=UPI002449930B